MSPEAPAQPVPERWVRLKPRIFVASYRYPPGASVRVWLPREFSGLNDAMPNGSTAPGKTFPPLAVPISGLTNAVGSATAAGSAARAGVAARSGATSAATAAATTVLRMLCDLPRTLAGDNVVPFSVISADLDGGQ